MLQPSGLDILAKKPSLVPAASQANQKPISQTETPVELSILDKKPVVPKTEYEKEVYDSLEAIDTTTGENGSRVEITMEEELPELSRFTTYNEYKQALDTECIMTGKHYVIASTTKGFKYDVTLQDVLERYTKHSISWVYIHKSDFGLPISTDGIPYINIGNCCYYCHLGVDKSKGQKLKYQHKKVMRKLLAENDPTVKLREKRAVPTKKVSCPARFSVKKIWRFPEYKVTGELTSWKKQTAAKELRDKLDLIKIGVCDDVIGRLEYVTAFPAHDAHKFHEAGKADWLVEPLDKQVEKYLRSEIRKGCIRNQELQQRGVDYVKNVLFSNEVPPNEERRRFFPNKKKIKNLIASEKRKMKTESDLQQQNVMHLNQLLDAVNEDLVGHTVTIDHMEGDSDSQPDENLIEQVNSQVATEPEEHFEDLTDLQRASKLKKLALLGKLGELTSICHNIKHTDVDVIDAISDNMDSVIQFAKEHADMTTT
ncbi:calcium-responsive transcription factor-like [Clytia hemisphaerica]|uniref:Uncharacterized protein n=1 Tax=Clytia hemisphaerica TaxID=252671 RepID=A0A7M5ULY3_9CNID